jgi:hypothetical protein
LALRGASLPWDAASSHEAGLHAKQTADLAKMLGSSSSSGRAHPAAAWVALARGTAFAAAPDYGAFGALLHELAALPETAAPAKGGAAETATGEPLNKRGSKAASGKAVSSGGHAVAAEAAAAAVGPHGTVIKSPSAKKLKKTAAPAARTPALVVTVVDLENTKDEVVEVPASSSSQAKKPRNRAPPLSTAPLPAASIGGASPPAKANDSPGPNTRSVSASASASASVTYTYEARQPLSQGDRRVNASEKTPKRPKALGVAKIRASRADGTEDDEEVATFEATVTVTATAQVTRRVASLSP